MLEQSEIHGTHDDDDSAAQIAPRPSVVQSVAGKYHSIFMLTWVSLYPGKHVGILDHVVVAEFQFYSRPAHSLGL